MPNRGSVIHATWVVNVSSGYVQTSHGPSIRGEALALKSVAFINTVYEKKFDTNCNRLKFERLDIKYTQFIFS